MRVFLSASSGLCGTLTCTVQGERAACEVREAVVMSPDVTRVNTDRNIHFALGALAAV